VQQEVANLSDIGPDSRAYNLNEILNSAVPSKFEVKFSFSTNTTIKGPGISNIHGIMPDDAETRKEYVSYPKQFSLMPVGKYRITTKKPVLRIGADDGTAMLVLGAPELYHGGRVVQMFKIPKQALTAIIGKTLATETRPYTPQ
jgi:hypothetical protein